MLQVWAHEPFCKGVPEQWANAGTYFKGKGTATFEQLSLEEADAGNPEVRLTPLITSMTITFMGRNSACKLPPPMSNIVIGSTLIKALNDIGATVNIMGSAQFRKIMPSLKLTLTKPSMHG
ncbi:hypothetical protein NDU88_001153 [Pleurodeles waltl]|uniref:Uncharacterized protein n=1 Tax=Pleurodeles waltl TaxID=8319 RepID=A0AAV7RA60_PLEWA|nr:hypothetical protein NDU88_001153 [Pleurodeles waltl]